MKTKINYMERMVLINCRLKCKQIVFSFSIITKQKEFPNSLERRVSGIAANIIAGVHGLYIHNVWLLIIAEEGGLYICVLYMALKAYECSVLVRG